MDSGQMLHASRVGAGLTQAELARRAGTSQATVSAYEHGRKEPSAETLARLLAATGARLAVVPGASAVIRPTAAQLARAGRGLVDVMLLAEALPTRHARELRFPPLAPLPPAEARR
jgi:transcriptional regulator with XRE-family HTH domain